MKLLDKLKKEVAANAKAKGKKKLLFTFKKDHFKSKLTTNNGFGVTDLKPTYFELYLHMLKKYGQKLGVTCIDAQGMKVEIYLR